MRYREVGEFGFYLCLGRTKTGPTSHTTPTLIPATPSGGPQSTGAGKAEWKGNGGKQPVRHTGMARDLMEKGLLKRRLSRLAKGSDGRLKYETEDTQ